MKKTNLLATLASSKSGPKLLKYVPVRKVQDLRNWLIIYGYWNAGGPENVAALCWTLAEKYLRPRPLAISLHRLKRPDIGLLHPEYEGYFEAPRAYFESYYERRSQFDPQQTVSTGTEGHQQRETVQSTLRICPSLLSCSTANTSSPISLTFSQLIRQFEAAGLVPLPIFINGVEGHVAVRDLITTTYEQVQRQLGIKDTPSLSPEAVRVDAIVSTIGFPLVGGPAGSMEAGRQVAVAKRILAAKNVPYLVAAPLLIQDIHSWTRQGIGGLQSVVLYALPELDGAIDTIPLGGLVGNQIYLIPERVQRLTGRLKRWIVLRQKATADRKLAIILYGFPPGYGATGTAALLNVPKSLLKLLQALKEQGYDVGELPENGEALIDQVRDADNTYADRPDAIEAFEARQALTTVTAPKLEQWLGYLLTQRMEKQWKSLTGTGIKTIGDQFLLGGVQLGKVWIGVQPPLGIAGTRCDLCLSGI